MICYIRRIHNWKAMDIIWLRVFMSMIGYIVYLTIIIISGLKAWRRIRAELHMMMATTTMMTTVLRSSPSRLLLLQQLYMGYWSSELLLVDHQVEFYSTFCFFFFMHSYHETVSRVVNFHWLYWSSMDYSIRKRYYYV